MKTSVAVHKLGDCISTVEDAGYEVLQVSNTDGLIEAETIGATLTVDIDPQDSIDTPGDATLTVEDAFVTDEGTVRIELGATVSDPADEVESESSSGSTTRPDPNPDEQSGETQARSTVPQTDPEDRTENGVTTPSNSAESPDPGSEDSTEDESSDRAGSSSGDDETAPTDHDSEGGEADGADDADGPAYRDPEKLRAAYESCETFETMTESLDVDVTPQTVRKYMIQHGIHEPSSRALTERSSGGDGEGGGDAPMANESESENGTHRGGASAGRDRTTDTDGHEKPAQDQEESHDDAGTDSPADDGAGTQPEEPKADSNDSQGNSDDAQGKTGRERLGDFELPEGVSLEAVKTAVQTGQTLYDVQRDLGLDRRETRDLLEDLDLLDLVVRRGSEVDPNTPLETIESRL